MNIASPLVATRYAKTVEVSKRVRWEIERDVIRGRQFDLDRTFLPAGLSLVDEIEFLNPSERRTLSQMGEPGRVAHRRRGTQPRRVVLLVDVSASMRPYADALLRLCHRIVTASPSAAGRRTTT